MTLLKNPPKKKIIDDYVAYRAAHGGWILVNRNLEGAQFMLPKSYNPVLFWLGLLTCWIYGLGIIFWLIGVLAYFMETKEVFYVDIERMEAELSTRDKRWL